MISALQTLILLAKQTEPEHGHYYKPSTDLIRMAEEELAVLTKTKIEFNTQD